MTYVSTVLGETGLVGFWELAEASGATATDQTGNSNGTYVNGGTGILLAQTGISGGGGATAAKFVQASSGMVTIPSVAANQTGNTLTLECWIKRTSSSGARQCLLGGNFATGANIEFVDASNTVLVTSPAGDLCTSGAVTVTADGNWHHIVYTKSGATNHLYIDGVDVTASVTNLTLNTNTAGWYLGRFTNNTSTYLDGTMAMVAIYNVALSSSQVATHYTLGSTAGGTNNPVTLTTSATPSASLQRAGSALRSLAQPQALTIARSVAATRNASEPQVAAVLRAFTPRRVTAQPQTAVIAGARAAVRSAAQGQAILLTRRPSPTRTVTQAASVALARSFSVTRALIASVSGGGAYGSGIYSGGVYGSGTIPGGPILAFAQTRNLVIAQPQTVLAGHISARLFSAAAAPIAGLSRVVRLIRAPLQPTLATRTTVVARTAATDPLGQFARLLTGQQQERFFTTTLLAGVGLAHHLRSVFRGSLPGRIVGAFRGFVR